jgi:dipeptidyl aminopeptidase/acylaminoacyl peptidase
MAGTRMMQLDDLQQIRQVSDPQISPDGAWVSYEVGTVDLEKDRETSDIWMTSWDGATTLRLTFSRESESMARFSPDNRFLAFLSSRESGQDLDQIWLLDRAGGEAQRLTDFKGSVLDYAWSPDGKRLAIIAEDPDPEATEPGKEKADRKAPAPIVIDRFQFKRDEDGYLGERHSHLYLFDRETRKSERLIAGGFDELMPAWSPDGSAIAFVTRMGPDPDRHTNWDIYVVGATPGGAPRRVTVNELPDSDPDFESRPAWSPDGQSIAFVQGGAQALIYYALHQVAVVPASGGPGRLLAAPLDRNQTKPVWSADGASLLFLLEEDRSVHLARGTAEGGAVERLLSGPVTASDFSAGPLGRISVLVSTPGAPAEVFALEGGALRPLSRQNEPLIGQLRLGAMEELDYKSKDGASIHGLMILPPDLEPGGKRPALLRLHGGPVGQFSHEFSFEEQLLASQGYVVITPNPRGSSGRGETFQRAIWADWGNKDAQDVLAAVDHVVARGLADPKRLGVGGWSYGGMLTNYVIAQDTRFKAAVSGASISNILAGYGTDQYIREYEAELGPPWRAPDVWLRVSFPFLHADRIVTPTLFLCGDADFNVPLLNSEQMYEALRSLGRDTRLIIYPDQHHGISRPSYQRDRLERYLAWYGKYVKQVDQAQPVK